MNSHTTHRELVTRIRDLTSELVTEADRFHARPTRETRRAADPSIEESTDWMRHTVRSLLMAIIALRNAEHAAHESQPS
jgi:hypothetical protein